jgi:hypothetical protein
VPTQAREPWVTPQVPDNSRAIFAIHVRNVLDDFIERPRREFEASRSYVFSWPIGAIDHGAMLSVMVNPIEGWFVEHHDAWLPRQQVAQVTDDRRFPETGSTDDFYDGSSFQAKFVEQSVD